VLEAHAELGALFEKQTYSPGDKARMLELMDRLGVLTSSEGPFALLRRIRGRLAYRPRDGEAQIVASGRDDWIGWVELKTAAVDETAMMLTARTIFEARADVLGLVEAESRPVLQMFQELFARRLELAETYAHVMLVDGNDQRGIDVGLATREGYPIGRVRSHADQRDTEGRTIFSRDCPEIEVETPSGMRFVVLVNHFKSKFGGNDARSRARRRAQAEAVAGHYRRLRCAGQERVAVLGDLNDTPDSAELAPLLQHTDLRDVSDHPAFTEFDFRTDNGNRGIGTYGLGNDSDKIDYLLLSPRLWERVARGGLFRKGAWPGSRPPRWDVYPELTEPRHAASDHHLIWADLDV
jgi:endonuclease/exonuclease/phosphatase family metal-dependent hydrolase